MQAKTGGLTNARYVEYFCANALRRPAEAKRLSAWAGQLDHSVPCAEVTTAIGLSRKAQQHHLARIEQDWLLT